MKDHYIFAIVIAGAIAIAWFHYNKEVQQNAANK